MVKNYNGNGVLLRDKIKKLPRLARQLMKVLLEL